MPPGERPESSREGALPVTTHKAGDLTEIGEKVAEATGIGQHKAEQAVAIALRERYEGSVPNPVTVAEYNRISPGIGTQLVQDYLDQQSHERHCDIEQIALARADSRRNDSSLRLAFLSHSSSSVFLFIFTGLAAFFGYKGELGLAALSSAAQFSVLLGNS